MNTARLHVPKFLVGLAISASFFALVGTFTALWPNPFFSRMTAAGDWEIGLLATQAMLFGTYFVVRRPACSVRLAGLGGIANFLGVACPVCNKVLLYLFGWDALMTYFDPTRLYLAAAGVFVTALAVVFELNRRFRPTGETAV